MEVKTNLYLDESKIELLILPLVIKNMRLRLI
jgi:hypothetical protein